MNKQDLEKLDKILRKASESPIYTTWPARELTKILTEITIMLEELINENK